MTQEKEKQMVEKLREHLRIAKSWNWQFEKMLFIDGFLSALNIATNKDYGYSGTDIYVTNKCGQRVEVNYKN